ncbi:MAG: cell division protein ZapB [SAR324 cluster bacterium]|nr:cell division protein ZapB [SAR324 cluster bacterium]
MSNDLLKQLEAKINEAIETIEFSRMEITDLKEKNDELENRYEDWEQRLSSLIEKFEQLEDVEAVEVEAEVDTSIQKDEEAEEVVAEETESEEVVAVETEAEEVEAEEVVAVETEEAEVDTDTDTEQFEGDEIEGSTFGTSADSYTEAPGSSQHYA